MLGSDGKPFEFNKYMQWVKYGKGSRIKLGPAKPNPQNFLKQKFPCKFCLKMINKFKKRAHEESCPANPINKGKNETIRRVVVDPLRPNRAK